MLLKTRYNWLFATLLFSIVLSIPIVYFFNIKSFSECNHSGNFVSLASSSIGGDFTLTDVKNKKQHSRELITKPSLIYFGYSFCPDVCPFDLQRNTIAVDILAEQGLEVTPIFITIDPERDTPSRLKQFSEFVHPNLIALTGSQKEIDDVMKIFKVYGKKGASGNYEKDNYLMDHSSFTYLVSYENKFLHFFKRQTTAEDMACQINLLID